MSAWAIMIRCCSPPDRFPIRASAKAVAPTASSISVDGGPALRRRSAIPKRCPSSPSPTRSRARSGTSASRAIFWGTYPICGLCRDRAPPVTTTRPPLGAIRPRITRSRVVFPAPFEPMSPQKPPASTEKTLGRARGGLRATRSGPRPGAPRRHGAVARAGCPTSRGSAVLPPTDRAHRHRCCVEAPVAMAFLMASSSAIIQVW